MNDPEIAKAYLESLVDDLRAAGIEDHPVRPNGFGVTVKEYAIITGGSEDVARRLLNSAVKKGLLVCHKMLNGGNSNAPWVFCRPAEWPPK